MWTMYATVATYVKTHLLIILGKRRKKSCVAPTAQVRGLGLKFNENTQGY